ncbi:MAG: MGH1-like glycoside hydrolase domain-containing protein, partial [Longimicrobiales bacterium]
MTQEELRLHAVREKGTPWKKWGPYLSERQWATVREDYSDHGAAWDYFTHDQARSRAYRWGEDGIAGLCDDQQQLCFALAFWNGADPILKERLFGLTNSEGNHGEDCKEYYYYLDATPTYSYLKFLYKYPQRAYPYEELVRTTRQRSRRDREYELIDTGIFADDRYFDIVVEYAKDSPEELVMQISVFNRGPEPATLHLLPTLWFRNTWQAQGAGGKPSLSQAKQEGNSAILARHPRLGERYLRCDRSVSLLFTENETNAERVFGSPNAAAHVKDGINEYVVHGRSEAVNAQRVGTKAAAHYDLVIPAGAAEVVRLRLGEEPPVTPRRGRKDLFGTRIAEQLEIRHREADEFYDSIAPAGVSADARNVMRQALAGMLWSMQYYQYPVREWLAEGAPDRPSRTRAASRNQGWSHLETADIISVPDKWEYPWFASWDLAFHAVVLARVDVDLAKEQLRLITRQRFAHPNGQLPAYEWNFSDVNPPVHASAAWQVYLLDKAVRGEGDIEFLASIFHRLLLNFTWWMNRKDRSGKNALEGGFLGLDNIGVLDRSVALPTGGHLEQADGTSWMAVYTLDMLTMALELAFHDSAYEDLACKFYEHFVHIAAALNNVGEQGVG